MTLAPPENNLSTEVLQEQALPELFQLKEDKQEEKTNFISNLYSKSFDSDPIQQKSETENNINENSSNTKQPANFITQMQSAFQTDFSNVNIHQNSKTATNLGALAYTQGNNVHFAPGQFKPDTQQGKELIGHEFAHVVQQRQGKVQANKQIGKFQINDNSGLEKEADVMGAKASRWNPN